MTTLRRIQSWLPLLRRPTTRSCQRAAPTTRTLRHATAAWPPQARPLALSASCGLRNTEDFSGGRRAGVAEEDEDEDFMDDSEVEELFVQQVPAGIGEGQHRVFIVHPDVKWGSRKQHLTTGNKCFYSSTELKHFSILISCNFLLHIISFYSTTNPTASVTSYFFFHTKYIECRYI